MGSGSQINIPERLKEKLHTDPQWESKVTNVIENIHKLLDTTPVFFPEYTNHGTIHIDHVLEISNKIISDKTLQKLSSKTLGIYIISAVLHDISMFINYDTFKKLIDDDTLTKVSPLDDKSLKECWNVYLSELKRFSSKTLVRKFGTTDINFKKLPPHKKMTSLDILVIGEFIRQHHHKISQYIVLNNLMDYDLLENTGINSADSYRKLIGILTRSHGMNVRDTEDYLEKHFSSAAKASGVEIYYLMCVLRLADYLDAGEERASHIIESMFVKYSDISKKEYSWNQCIRYEDFNWEVEKESLTIDAMPDNPEQFINVTKWLNAVQSELDLCWAIIGEHYNLQEYRFSIRRICSNLLKKSSVEEYEKKFYTKAVSLNANPDILKLLIEPLYGNDPCYGMRELIQNATDACKERKAINKKYDGKVTVSLDTKKNLLTVTDNGIGMNIDTIVNYYLSAGASYRSSEEWTKSYSDSKGKSKVKRNGRFGIGVLATFLLGDVATITTRHIDDDLGWTFDIRLNQDNIEIKRIPTDIGTTVSITLSSTPITKLTSNHSWDYPNWNQWYTDDFPMVLYYIDGKAVNNAVSDNLSWHTLKQKDYKKYCWAYDPENEGKDDHAICNGIIIPTETSFDTNEKYRLHINTPKLRIEDTEGRLPVNLSRSQLVEVPCQQELYLECCKYILAKLLTSTRINAATKNKLHSEIYFYANKEYDCTDLIFSSKGYILDDSAFMAHAGIQHLNVLYNDLHYQEIKNTFRNVPVTYREYYDAFHGVNMNISNFSSSRDFFGHDVSYNINYIFANSEANIIIRDYVKRNKRFNNFYNIDYLGKVQEYDVWGCLPLDQINAGDFADLKYPIIVEFEFKGYRLPSDDIMLNVIREYIPPNTFIPYDLEERKKLFPKAFNELKAYMDDCTNVLDDIFLK